MIFIYHFFSQFLLCFVFLLILELNLFYSFHSIDCELLHHICYFIFYGTSTPIHLFVNPSPTLGHFDIFVYLPRMMMMIIVMENKRKTEKNKFLCFYIFCILYRTDDIDPRSAGDVYWYDINNKPHVYSAGIKWAALVYTMDT